MKKIFLLFTLLSVPFFAQEKITAEEAIKIGLKNNFDIQIAKNNQEIAENNAGLGTSGFLPKLDATGNYNLGSTKTETNSPFSFGDTDTRSYGAKLSLNWTLFDGFRMFVNKSKYDDLAKLGEFQARNTIESSVVGILRAYFNLVAQQKLLEISKISLEVSELRYNKTKVREEMGAVSTTDLLNAQVAYNSDKSNLISQELTVEIARKDLLLALGLEQSKQIKVDDDINTTSTLYNYEDLKSRVFQQNSTLLSAQQSLLVSEADQSLATSNYYPVLSLNSGYGYTDSKTARSNNPTDINSKTTDATIGLTLSFNLFNGLRDDIARQNAIIGVKNSEFQLNKTQNQVEGLLNEKFLTYNKRIEKLKIEQENINAAKQNLELQRDKLETGTANSLEFRDAQLNYVRAENSLINAKLQFKIAEYELKQLTGDIPVSGK